MRELPSGTWVRLLLGATNLVIVVHTDVQPGAAKHWTLFGAIDGLTAAIGLANDIRRM